MIFKCCFDSIFSLGFCLVCAPGPCAKACMCCFWCYEDKKAQYINRLDRRPSHRWFQVYVVSAVAIAERRPNSRKGTKVGSAFKPLGYLTRSPLPWCTNDVLNELNCFCDPAFSKGPESAAMYLEQVPTLQRARSKVTLEQRALYWYIIHMCKIFERSTFQCYR